MMLEEQVERKVCTRAVNFLHSVRKETPLAVAISRFDQGSGVAWEVFGRKVFNKNVENHVEKASPAVVTAHTGKA
jgi:hypothetical protein